MIEHGLLCPSFNKALLNGQLLLNGHLIAHTLVGTVLNGHLITHTLLVWNMNSFSNTLCGRVYLLGFIVCVCVCVCLELPDIHGWELEEEQVRRRRYLRDTHLIFSIDPQGCEDVDDTLSVRFIYTHHTVLSVYLHTLAHTHTHTHTHSLSLSLSLTDT